MYCVHVNNAALSFTRAKHQSTKEQTVCHTPCLFHNIYLWHILLVDFRGLENSRLHDIMPPWWQFGSLQAATSNELPLTKKRDSHHKKKTTPFAHTKTNHCCGSLKRRDQTNYPLEHVHRRLWISGIPLMYSATECKITKAMLCHTSEHTTRIQLLYEYGLRRCCCS